MSSISNASNAESLTKRIVHRTFNRETLLGIGTILSILIIWEVGSRTGIVDPRFFPPPTAVSQGFAEMYTSGEFLVHFRRSLRRVLLGFLLGSSTGILVGLLMGWFSLAKSILDPYISILYPIPKIVLLPVFFIFLGVGEPARVLTITIAVFLLTSINTMRGVREIENVYIEAARDNGASGMNLFKEVVIPRALPQIFTGLSLGIGVSFILLVLVEMVGADNGLGFVIWNSWEQFTIVRMYVAILTINALGIICVYGIEFVGKVITPWQ